MLLLLDSVPKLNDQERDDYDKVMIELEEGVLFKQILPKSPQDPFVVSQTDFYSFFNFQIVKELFFLCLLGYS